MSPNLLYKTRAYLAGNMETVADFQSWRDEVTVKLNKMGVICLDPSKETFINTRAENEEFRDSLIRLRESDVPGDFEKMQEIMKSIIRKDLRLVDLADFIICFLTPESPTYGTTHELVNAANDRKPIVFVMRDYKKIPLWVSRYSKKSEIFQDIDGLVGYLQEVNDGKVTLDENRWKLLKPEYR